jgi:hypothetical protein
VLSEDSKSTVELVTIPKSMLEDLLDWTFKHRALRGEGPLPVSMHLELITPLPAFTVRVTRTFAKDVPPPPIEEVRLEAGWLGRQIESACAEVSTWPESLRKPFRVERAQAVSQQPSCVNLNRDDIESEKISRLQAAYSEFVAQAQPGIDFYNALGRRAESMREANSKLPP